jgi:hypothetical protein
MTHTYGRTIVCSVVGLVLLAGAGAAGAQGTPSFDHLKCYKLKDFAPKKAYAVDLIPDQDPPFSVEQGCKIMVPAKLFCIDVIKQNVQPPPPGTVSGTNARDYLCYKVKCPKQVLPIVTVEDQFGRRDLTIKPPKFVCAPANKVIPPTRTPTPTKTRTPTPTRTLTPTRTRTPTPTRTLTPTRTRTPTPTRTITPTRTVTPSATATETPTETRTPIETPTPTATQTPGMQCQFGSDGVCAGDCPPMLHCVAITSPGGSTFCDCVPGGQLCHLGDDGMCGGVCPNPAHVCIPDAVGCNCGPPPGCSMGGGGTAGQCGGPCPDPATQKCLFEPAMGNCACVPNAAMCMPQGPAPTQCGGLCPGAPGTPGSNCTPNAAGACNCS